ncbi:hypothetical protein FD754_013648 [Muntiacus muntjak]|uniref:Uncharacterized protein n=1 Tax=Muntiacus muntjak TaxID=9888 RepID=A0A5N3VHR0_MUNMU|nr:hypothetical protein FD754_013648 [Muntiacus muntjak]
MYISCFSCIQLETSWDRIFQLFPLNIYIYISVSLLAVVVSFCGLALLVVSLFVFWKLCWPFWKSKPMTSNVSTLPQSMSSAPTEVFETEEKKEIKENGEPALKVIEPAIKISHTSPDIPAEVQTAVKEHLVKHARVQRQTTEPTSSSRWERRKDKQEK